MKAYGKSFSVIRNDYLYEIPFFQRRYVWKEENWRELLDSLSNPDDCPFLGSIILKENKSSDGTIFWTVIDGQQRLTTLSILMRACYDELFAIKDTYKDELTWIRNVILPFDETTHIEDKDDKDVRHPKIRHSYIDRTDFEKVIDGKLKDTYSEIDLDNAGGIIKCYCFFRKELKDNIKAVNAIWKYLTDKIDDYKENGKYLVIIELGTKENEQAIFDTINTAGVRLTSADTIKNAVFQRYIVLLEGNGNGQSSEKAQAKAAALYKEQWDGIFSNTQEKAEYWNKARQVGRLYRDNIELLLHYIAVIKGFYDPSDKKLSDLPQCYKDYVSGLSNAKDIEEFIKEINSYAKLYQKHFKEIGSLSYDESSYISRLMHISDVLEISTFFPYILYLLKEQDERNDVKDRFTQLEQYLILHAVCGETTKNYNKVCLQLIRGTTTIRTLLEGCENINSDKFEYGLRHMNSNKLATLLLFWVELYKRKTEYSYSDSEKLDYKFTLEHIMPQKWEEHWSDVPVYDENGELVVDEEQKKKIRYSAIYEIGNMTLLSSKLNTSVSNKDFKRKIEGEVEKKGKKEIKGMRYLADCMITRELLEKQDWNEKTIRERTAELSKIVRTLWGDFLE